MAYAWESGYERLADRSAELAAIIGQLCIEIKTATVYHTMDPASAELANAIAALNRTAAKATKAIHGSGK